MITVDALRRALANNTPKREPTGASAAILIPVLETATGLQLLFTKRPESLRSHPGQVSFPGGRIDPGDPDAASAALRETWEELGIPASDITIIGTLDDMITGTGYTVAPHVGLLARTPMLRPNPAEVEDSFFYPLDALAPESGWRALDITREGHQYRVWFFDGAPYTIWGVTGEITRRLCKLLV